MKEQIMVVNNTTSKNDTATNATKKITTTDNCSLETTERSSTGDDEDQHEKMNNIIINNNNKKNNSINHIQNTINNDTSSPITLTQNINKRDQHTIYMDRPHAGVTRSTIPTGISTGFAGAKNVITNRVTPPRPTSILTTTSTNNNILQQQQESNKVTLDQTHEQKDYLETSYTGSANKGNNTTISTATNPFIDNNSNVKETIQPVHEQLQQISSVQQQSQEQQQQQQIKIQKVSLSSQQPMSNTNNFHIMETTHADNNNHVFEYSINEINNNKNNTGTNNKIPQSVLPPLSSNSTESNKNSASTCISSTNDLTSSSSPNNNGMIINENKTTTSTLILGSILPNYNNNNNNNTNNNLLSTEKETVDRFIPTITSTTATTNNNYKDQEQILFEQRLCDERCGIAVRKINQHGKASVRYVKCITLQGSDEQMESRSLHGVGGVGFGNNSISSHNSSTSFGGRFSLYQNNQITTISSTIAQQQQQSQSNSNTRRVLSWGKRKDVQIPLHCFTCVRKGKTTNRTRKNSVSSNRILSLIPIQNLSSSSNYISLDIEAPTQLDRDKFAKAFSNFLNIPLIEENNNSNNINNYNIITKNSTNEYDSTSSRNSVQSSSRNELNNNNNNAIATAFPTQLQQQQQIELLSSSSLTAIVASTQQTATTTAIRSGGRPPTQPQNQTVSVTTGQQQPHDLIINSSYNTSTQNSSSSKDDKPIVAAGNIDNDYQIDRSPHPEEPRQSAAIVNIPFNTRQNEKGDKGDARSIFSSLTGHGFDQELIEELHHALNEARTELVESRAEASRAVKVAEQAIQSAEKNKSTEWQNTVTHKAAEAAAKAQKQSANAMARARLAEERLEGEKRTAQFWKKQAEIAEEEGGILQTRAASAEVQRSAIEEQLKLERLILQKQVQILKEQFNEININQRDTLDDTLERNRSLEIELDTTRRDLLMIRNEYIDYENNNNSVSNNNTNNNMNDSFSSKSSSNIVKKKLSAFSRKKKSNSITNTSNYQNDSKVLLLSSDALSSSSTYSSRNPLTLQETRDANTTNDESITNNSMSLNATSNDEKLKLLHNETKNIKKELEKMRRATFDDVRQLPYDAKLWSNQINNVILTSQNFVVDIQNKLAMECANRRKLLNEVQDLRGTIRVYCRPRLLLNNISNNNNIDDITLSKNTTTSSLINNEQKIDQESNNNKKITSNQKQKLLISVPSHDTLVLHRENYNKSNKNYIDIGNGPISFEYDRVFSPESNQQEIYSEIEDVCLSVLDGYNICIMAYGSSNCGKTHTLLGNVIDENGDEYDNKKIVDDGIQLRLMKQLFSIAEHRSERYKDVFSITIVEVYDEKLCDLLAGTKLSEQRGELVTTEISNNNNNKIRKEKSIDDSDDFNSDIVNTSSYIGKNNNTKLEIRTDVHGETIVQGSYSVTVESYDEVLSIWEECLTKRKNKLIELGINEKQYESSCHIFSTLKVVSNNITTGTASIGKVQFVDLASVDITQKQLQQQPNLTPPIIGGSNNKNKSPQHRSANESSTAITTTSLISQQREWRYTSRSLETLYEVIEAKAQFERTVPYRNSTLTHLLQDSLEGDTKVIFIACITANPNINVSNDNDLKLITSTLRFASSMRRINIGKATRHTSLPYR